MHVFKLPDRSPVLSAAPAGAENQRKNPAASVVELLPGWWDNFEMQNRFQKVAAKCRWIIPRLGFGLLVALYLFTLTLVGGFRSVLDLVAIWACLGATRPLVRWGIFVGLWTLLIAWAVWVVGAPMGSAWPREFVQSILATLGVVILLSTSRVLGARIEKLPKNGFHHLRGPHLSPVVWLYAATAVVISLIVGLFVVNPFVAIDPYDYVFLY